CQAPLILLHKLPCVRRAILNPKLSLLAKVWALKNQGPVSIRGGNASYRSSGEFHNPGANRFDLSLRKVGRLHEKRDRHKCAAANINHLRVEFVTHVEE